MLTDTLEILIRNQLEDSRLLSKVDSESLTARNLRKSIALAKDAETALRKYILNNVK